MSLRLLPRSTVVLGRETDGFAPREWTSLRPTGTSAGSLPASQLDRTATHAQTVLGAGSNGSTSTVLRGDRLLTPEQARLIYERTPDVRAAIDGIVRRVATTDFDVVPLVDPDHEDYDEAAEEGAAIADWLAAPTLDGDLFQEELTKTLTDLLTWDAGAMELVPQKRKPSRIEELVSIRGCDVHPRRDDRGRLLDYVQEPRTSVSASATRTVLSPSQVLYLRLFPNNEGPEGLPLLESLVYEVAAILRAAETVCSAFNLNELPPGILVVAGLARDAQKRFNADFETKRGQDWKMRPLFSETAGVVDAKWVELARAPRELQIAELVKDIQRTIWRVFGVTPIEMGDPVDSNRATATVQVDVGTSHLLTPILDLIEAKFTRVVVPRRLVDPTLTGLVGFRWRRMRDLSPDEEKARAEALKTYVGEGIMTTNEARHAIGQRPRPEGDVLRVGTSTLAAITEPVEADGSDAEGSDKARDDEAPDDGEDEDDTDAEAEADDAEAEADDDERRRAPSRKVRRPHFGRSRRRRARQRHAEDGPVVRAADEMPSEWQTPGRFDGVRTLDLRGLWEEVAGYGAEVGALWEEARASVVSIVNAHYRPRGFDAPLRQRVSELVIGEVERLYVAWSVETGPRYDAVAVAAARSAARFTGTSEVLDQARARADLYHQLAMGYLVAPDGLLTDLRDRIGVVLVAVTDVRGSEPPPSREVLARAPILSPEAETEAVLLAVAAAFDALRHRITNWSGKLLDLAYQVLSEEVAAGASSGRAEGIQDAIAGEPVEWWCEWIAVGDKGTCDTCRAEAGKGFQPLASLAVRPGSGTRCRSNCRCVLVLWTKAEIDGGRAESLNPRSRRKARARALPVPPKAPARRSEEVEAEELAAAGALPRETVRRYLVEHYTGAPMAAPRVRELVAQWKAGHHRSLLRPPEFGIAFRGLQVLGSDLSALLGDSGVALSALRTGIVRFSDRQARALTATMGTRDRSWTLHADVACDHAEGKRRDDYAAADPGSVYAAVLLVVGPADLAGWLLNAAGAADEDGVGSVEHEGEPLRAAIRREGEVLTAEAQQPFALVYARRDAIASDPSTLRNLVDALVVPIPRGPNPQG